MRRFTKNTADPTTIFEELLHGGAVGVSGLFAPEDIAEGRT